MEKVSLERPQGAIWDLDGTLLHSFWVFVSVLGEVWQEESGQILDPAVARLNHHGSLTDSIMGCLGVEEGYARILEARFIERQQAHHEDQDRYLFPDAVAIAQDLAAGGAPQLLVTNRKHTGQGKASPRAIISGSVLAASIQEVSCIDEVAFPKPDARVASDWMLRHEIAPDKLLIFGDTYVDAQLAINLGAKAIILARPENSDPLLSNLAAGWEEHVQVVESLHGVEFV